MRWGVCRIVRAELFATPLAPMDCFSASLSWSPLDKLAAVIAAMNLASILGASLKDSGEVSLEH